jgi:hypothetical protein
VIMERRFFHFYKSVIAVKMCCDKKEQIKTISIREAQPEELEDAWGWYDLKRNKLVFIYPRLILLEMCFPYGMDI